MSSAGGRIPVFVLLLILVLVLVVLDAVLRLIVLALLVVVLLILRSTISYCASSALFSTLRMILFAMSIKESFPKVRSKAKTL